MRSYFFAPRKGVFPIVLLAGLAAACGPRHDHGNNNANNNANSSANTTTENGERGGRHRFRVACAADIQKFCANVEKRREQKECLRNNLDKITPDCKTALERRHGEGRKDKQDNANDKDDD